MMIQGCFPIYQKVCLNEKLSPKTVLLFERKGDVNKTDVCKGSKKFLPPGHFGLKPRPCRRHFDPMMSQSQDTLITPYTYTDSLTGLSHLLAFYMQ